MLSVRLVIKQQADEALRVRALAVQRGHSQLNGSGFHEPGHLGEGGYLIPWKDPHLRHVCAFMHPFLFELTWQDEGQVLQMRKQEVLAGPQIAHGGSGCVWTGAQLVDHLEEEFIFTFLALFFTLFQRHPFQSLRSPGSRAQPGVGPAVWGRARTSSPFLSAAGSGWRAGSFADIPAHLWTANPAFSPLRSSPPAAQIPPPVPKSFHDPYPGPGGWWRTRASWLHSPEDKEPGWATLAPKRWWAGSGCGSGFRGGFSTPSFGNPILKMGGVLIETRTQRRSFTFNHLSDPSQVWWL